MAATSLTSTSPAPVSVDVATTGDVACITGRARRLAEAIGFRPAECEEVALVASELASNLVRHAGGGLITLDPLQLEERKGIQIESADHGPGIPDVELAIKDGFSTSGGLGNGLGTVNRLMDKLEFYRRPPRGLQIVCQRWVRPLTQTRLAQRLICGAATRPCRTASENGDAILLKHWSDQALLGVIDGLGHGPSAHKAALAARTYVEHHFDQPLRDLFRGVDRTCRSTRGVVMALAKFDLTRTTVTLAGIGNIEVRLVGVSSRTRMLVRRGILGLHASEPPLSEHPWTSNAVLIMHSDGVQSRWQWENYLALSTEPPGVLAQRLLRDFGKAEDDATVLVARNAAS